MTDLSAGISRIYSFISNQDWRKEMDKDGNGSIIEKECRYYLKENLDEWCDLEDKNNADDIITKFWRTINTDKGGDDLVRLNDKEIAAMETQIEFIKKLDEYVKTLEKEFTTGGYNKLVGSDVSKWLDSVKASLANSMQNFIKKGGKPEDLIAFFEGNAIETFYDKNQPVNLKLLAMNKAAANLYAKNHLESELKDKFDIYDQNVLDKIREELEKSDISKLIQNDITPDLSIQGIKDKVDMIVDQYVGWGDEDYPFSAEEQQKALTGLQVYRVKEHLTAVLKAIKNEVGYTDNKDLYDKAVSSYIDKMITGKAMGDYKDLMSLSYDDILNSDEFKEVQDVISEIARLEDLKKLPDDFWNGLPDQITVKANETLLYNLPSSYTTPNGVVVDSTQISYKSSNSIVSVSSDGTVKVTGGTNKGTYSVTVILLCNGNEVSSKTISVKVTESIETIMNNVTDKRMALGEVDNWNSEANLKDLYTNDKTVILYGKMDTRHKDWSRIKGTVLNNLKILGEQVKSILLTAGLNQAFLSTAINTVINNYYNAGAIKHKNDKGTHRSDLINHGISYMNENREATKSRIVWTVDEDAKDSNVYMIHFKDFIDDILDEYLRIAA